MKKYLLLLIALLLCVVPTFAGAEGAEAFYFAPFEAEDLNGEETVTEAVFENAVFTFINFWATWCPPCVAELPALAVLDEETDGDIQVIGVLMDAISPRGERDENAIAAMRVLLDNAQAEFPVLYPEGEAILGVMFGIQAVPTTLVVDQQGLVVDIHVGAMSLQQWLAYADSLLDDA